MTEESADYTCVAAVPGPCREPAGRGHAAALAAFQAGLDSRGATAVACGRTVQSRRTILLLAGLPTSLSR